jgi:acrylyl-CoA reductase (NADPH)
MTTIPSTFRAFVAQKTEDGRVRRGLRDFQAADLPDGDVEVRVDWSSVNYKDALATIAEGKVARISPLIPGIDLAGVVVASADPTIVPGDGVVAHGYDLGVARHGGYGAFTRLPAGYVVPLPAGLGARDAMAIGTAGFTAAMSVAALERHGLRPGDGPVLVTGASGGVGSVAVAILAARGHEVWAATGKADEEERLRRLGAVGIVPLEECTAVSPRPLESARWAGAVDTVGAATLPWVLRTLRPGGAVASSGNASGAALDLRNEQQAAITLEGGGDGGASLGSNAAPEVASLVKRRVRYLFGFQDSHWGMHIGVPQNVDYADNVYNPSWWQTFGFGFGNHSLFLIQDRQAGVGEDVVGIDCSDSVGDLDGFIEAIRSVTHLVLARRQVRAIHPH